MYKLFALGKYYEREQQPRPQRTVMPLMLLDTQLAPLSWLFRRKKRGKEVNLFEIGNRTFNLEIGCNFYIYRLIVAQKMPTEPHNFDDSLKLLYFDQFVEC